MDDSAKSDALDDEVVQNVVQSQPGVFNRSKASYDRNMQRLREEVARRQEQLERNRQLGVWIVASRRFVEIHGSSLAGQLALGIFAGVIPLIVLFFAWTTAFSSSTSVAEPIIRELGLTGATADLVRATFAASSDAKAAATIIGVGSFLLVGYTLGTTLQETFARAWQVRPMEGTRALARGVLWLAVFLVQVMLIEVLRNAALGADGIAVIGAGVLTFVVGFGFWLVTPRLLLDVHLGWRGLVPTALAGAISAALFRLATGFVLPSWLNYYGLPFGALGVILALVFWVWVLTYLWVAVAAFGAAWWERRAGDERVLTVQTEGSIDDPELDDSSDDPASGSPDRSEATTRSGT